ncbi:MAG: endonuclease domain-containing protein [Nitrospirae bacterium]|nr:endonuclease domain-containing protein [Nitrospirota bacterium]
MTTLGKALRKRPTDAEQLLWNHLRMKQMEGLKFIRQQPIDKYIVDFVCFENRIIIEVDGGQHAAERNKDIERDAYLQRFGFKVLRFWNNEVLAAIRESCLYHPPLNPLPPREGKRKRGQIYFKSRKINLSPFFHLFIVVHLWHTIFILYIIAKTTSKPQSYVAMPMMTKGTAGTPRPCLTTL